MKQTKKVYLELKAELLIPYDEEHPELTQSIPDMLARLTSCGRENKNYYAVNSDPDIKENQKKYTADLRITDARVIGPVCPVCNHVLDYK